MSSRDSNEWGYGQTKEGLKEKIEELEKREKAFVKLVEDLVKVYLTYVKQEERFRILYRAEKVVGRDSALGAFLRKHESGGRNGQ